jgi:hypothetical protein
LDSDRNTYLLVAAGVIAAAVIGAVAVVKWPRKRIRELASAPLRDVQEVLTDCYTKIREIEDRIAEMGPSHGLTDPVLGRAKPQTSPVGS